MKNEIVVKDSTGKVSAFLGESRDSENEFAIGFPNGNIYSYSDSKPWVGSQMPVLSLLPNDLD